MSPGRTICCPETPCFGVTVATTGTACSVVHFVDLAFLVPAHQDAGNGDADRDEQRDERHQT